MASTMTEKVIYHVKDDPAMQDAYVDVEEKRERILADGRIIPFLYVHGGFAEKKIKFIYCIPEKEAFAGRFFHYLSPFPGPDEETASMDKKGEDDRIGFALVHGAAFVESNMGSEHAFGGAADSTLCWKASAAVAEYCRTYIMEKYGVPRPYGYVYGGSGGGYKSLACIENTDAWDGACPFVIGSPVSLPNTITMHVQGQRRLRHKYHEIVDAVDVGGSGDPYEKLNADEAAMLRELTLMGFPPIMWFVEDYGLTDPGALPVLTPNVHRTDEQYFKDFWEVPGYLGAVKNGPEQRDRICFKSRVVAVHSPEEVETAEFARNGVDDAYRKQMTSGKGAWIELEELPQGEDLYTEGVDITFSSGDACGCKLLLGSMIPKKEGKGGYITIGFCFGRFNLNELIGKIRPGDELTLDNSDYIAVQSYYRHQVPADTDFHAWDQFRNPDGTPAIPQRKNVMGYSFTGTGTVQDGNIQGKVIMTQSLFDESTCTWCADWYRSQVIRSRGSEDDYRLQYMDNTMHGDVGWLENNRITNYLGALQQALLNISDWVEQGIEPPRSTGYRMVDNIAVLPKSAKERGGIQNVIEFTACAGDRLSESGDCVRAKVGEKVSFRIKALVPDGLGRVSDIRFAKTELRIFPDRFSEQPLDAFPEELSFTEITEDGMYGACAEAAAVYDKPGTYFASVRVRNTRSADKKDVYTQVRNLARVRVIVE